MWISSWRGDTDALTALEQQGLNEFRNGGSQCTNCHNGAELTAAGWSVVQRRAGNIAVPANLGFFRIGVRPIADDIGFGGNDDFGLPLFAPAPGSAAGTFKAPGLRNVEFTGPYFHNGSQATLEQVLLFYSRNGDFPDGGNLGPRNRQHPPQSGRSYRDRRLSEGAERRSGSLPAGAVRPSFSVRAERTRRAVFRATRD